MGERKKQLHKVRTARNNLRRYFLTKCLLRKKVSAVDLIVDRKLRKEQHRLETARYLHKCVPYRRLREQSTGRISMFLSGGERAYLNEEEFKNEYGMSRSSFHKLHDLIKGHEVFKKKKGPPKMDSAHQLLILLSFLRTEGSGKSTRRSRTTFDVGTGSLSNHRDRCVQAILARCAWG